MGRGIVMAVVSAGIPVIAVGLDQANIDAAMKAIAKMWSSSVAKGSMSQETMDKRLALITASDDPRDLSPTQLVIEAVTEDLAIKKTVFAKLGEVTPAGTILASNTSFLNIDALAEASGRPEDVCGMHFFNPAHVMRLLENVRAAKTDPEVVATIMALGKRIGKLPVLSGVCDGFIVNRMLAKRSREGFFLVEEGAKPADIDKVLLSYGFPMGPFALGDLAGLDVQAAARKARAATATDRELRADFPEQMVAAGRLGQKTGSGWYSYDENRRASANPLTDAMIAAHAERHGLTLREVGEDEIRERLLYAMVNEGAKLLSEGIVPRPHEIDVALVNGLGWPSYTGGPMHWADQIGLDMVLAKIETFRAGQGDAYWTPAPLLERYAREGRGFYA
jgi:3-hydroxyacyl-CoA dehydrogenase